MKAVVIVAVYLLGFVRQEPPAHLIVINARIWTGVPGQADAEALAVREGRLVALGRSEEVRKLAGEGTKVIDAGGRRVIPGLTDAHTHIISGGISLARLSLREVPDKAAFIRAVGDDAAEKPRGQWVLGGRWSIESWKNPEPPTRHWLDPVTGHTPVFLERMDGHQALVNTAALHIAGIDVHGPPDPKGGEIERDPATGEPTGILKDAAMDLVSKHIPEPDEDALYAALLRAMKHLNTLGITSVHDMSDPAHLPVFARAHREGTLTVRIHSFLSTSDWDANIAKVRDYPIRDDLYRVAGFKGYMDGSLGSRNAFMREPFADAAPGAKYPRGQLTDFADPPGEFQQIVARADAAGLQLAVHAIGDEANHLLLDAYEKARSDDAEGSNKGGRTAADHDTTGRIADHKSVRHRIEHAQHLLLEDIPRFAALDVVASMQPYHKADDGRYAEKALGAARLPGSYAFRRLLDAGAIVVFGSDWPVVTADPFAGIDAAVNSRTLAGDVWQRDNAITVAEALASYTRHPAFAAHAEDRLGTLEPGKLADFVILTEDVLTVPPERIAVIRAYKTFMNGREVGAALTKQK